MATKKVSAGDLRSLQYFWNEKDDFERCVLWKDLQAGLLEEYPEIVKAWADYKAARTIVTAAMEHAVDRAEANDHDE